MFEAYFLEEYDKDTIVTEHGFCMYVLNKEADELFCSDFYIKPEYRSTYENKKLASKIFDVAKEHGCSNVTGIVSLGVKSPERSTKLLKTYLSLGFTVYKATNNQILIGKKVDCE